MTGRHRLLAGAVAALLVGGCLMWWTVARSADLQFVRESDPGRTVVRDARGRQVATFTDGARTAVLRGTRRVLAEPQTTSATVSLDVRVRLLPWPWTDGREHSDEFRSWFRHASADTGPDLVDVAMQYVRDAPDRFDGAGLRIAGDARYGPRRGDTRAEDSDFLDYLGTDWAFPGGGTATASRGRRGALDCSGYIRMIFGYRSGHPLARGADAPAGALPRRAVSMATDGPGVPLPVPAGGGPVPDLQVGDLVFFDADPGDGPAVDHVGMYLGRDSEGGYRFISSRKSANGPTMGDRGGASLLDGDGLYAEALRTARRL